MSQLLDPEVWSPENVGERIAASAAQLRDAMPIDANAERAIESAMGRIDGVNAKRLERSADVELLRELYDAADQVNDLGRIVALFQCRLYALAAEIGQRFAPAAQRQIERDDFGEEE